MLPELANTGYVFETAGGGRRASPSRCRTARRPAPGRRSRAELGIHIVAGIAERAGDILYNAAVIVGPEGYIGTYRKAHLWDRENLFFAKGDLGFPVFDTALGRIGVAICYDGWFPETFRQLALGGRRDRLRPDQLGADARPARGRGRHGQLLHRAAAHSNGIFIACADRVGVERGQPFEGQSLIVGPQGWPLAGPASRDRRRDPLGAWSTSTRPRAQGPERLQLGPARPPHRHLRLSRRSAHPPRPIPKESVHGRNASLARPPPRSPSRATAAQAADGEPITIGVPVGLSGANSVVAPSVVQAAELAVEEINAKGGVLGRKLALEVADDASGAAGAQKAFDSLIYQKKVDVLISMETSAARNAGLPIVTKGKVPYIYTSFYEGHSCNKNLFVDAWVPEQQVPPIVDDFIKDKGAKTFFLIGSDYAFGRGMLAFAKSYIEKTGGKVVGEEYLPMDGSDWTAIISKLKEAKPDALITSTAGGAPNVTLTKQLRAAGVTLPYANLAVDEGTAKSMGADADGHLPLGLLRHRHRQRRRTRPSWPPCRRSSAPTCKTPERPLGAGIRGGLPLQGRGREGRRHRDRQGARGAADVSLRPGRAARSR